MLAKKSWLLLFANCLLCGAAFAYPTNNITLTFNCAATNLGPAIPDNFVGMTLSRSFINGAGGSAQVFNPSWNPGTSTTTWRQFTNILGQIGIHRTSRARVNDGLLVQEALRRWMHSVVKFVATKKGMSSALALAIAKDSELVSYSSERLTRAIGLLLEQAIAAGEIRNDVSPGDLLRAIVGMCYAHDQPGWQKNVLQLVDIFIGGLRN